MEHQAAAAKIRYYHTSLDLISFRLPAIACDIDGVVLRGSLIIGNSSNMVK